MPGNNDDITLFAETNYRGVKRRFGIKRNDRRRHMYIIGKTGMGKTTLLENMTIQDIQSGEGVCIVDPHGEYAERMLDFVPPSRINDVVYFNPSDLENPIGFNVMEDVGAERRHLVSSGLIGVFKKIWPDVWSARMEYLLSNSILALLETPGTTLLGINRILADKDFRKQIVGNCKDPIVKAFWENEYARYTEKFAAEAGAAVQNKIGQFTSNPLIRNIIGQPKSTIDMRKIMDEKKIFIVNLSKGRIGEENSKLLGAMLITRLYLAAMTRVDIPEPKREDFYVYVDEFQNFATESFASILSEARKYRLDLILAHQYIEQMDETVQAAVFGNVGSMITFRVGATDAELLEKELMPEFTQQDIVNLGFASIYMRLMIDGVASRPFSATTLPPVPVQDRSYKDEIVTASRSLYSVPRAKVDDQIMEWQGFNNANGVHIVARPADMSRREGQRQQRPPEGFLKDMIPPRPSAGAGNRDARPPMPPRSAPKQESRPVDTIRTLNSPPSIPKLPAQEAQPRQQPPQPPRQDRPQPHREPHMNTAQRPPQQNQPYRPTLDIRQPRPHQGPAQPALRVQKPDSFASLSALKQKESQKPEPRKDEPAKQPKEEKKSVDFTELKKALSESFQFQKPKPKDSVEAGVLRDKTGMLRPRTPEGAPKTDAKKSGVLNPGDRITFDD